MSTEWWLQFSKIVSYIGLFLVFASTVSTSILSAKNDRIKDQRIDTLVKGNGELLKKIDLYQNDLKEKQRKIEELEQYAKKDIYKPPTESIVTEVTANLQQLAQGELKEIVVDVIDGSNDCKRVRQDLVSIFKKAGINARTEKTGFSFSKSVSVPSMEMNENMKGIAIALTEAIQPYMTVKFHGKVKKTLEDGIIRIILKGNPLFHDDGSVEFK